MDGITNSNINLNKIPYTILKEFILSSNTKGDPLAYIEWNTSFNILSCNEHMKSILNLTDTTILKLNEVIPYEYLQHLKEHIQDLQTSKKHYSIFNYNSDIKGVVTTNTWLSALEGNKVISICCYIQTTTPLQDSLTTLLEVIPTPALILTSTGEYISCNTLMLKLLNIPTINNVTGSALGTLGENPSLCKYLRAALGLAKPNLIREIQTTFNLSNGNKVYYLFSYCKHNSSIILIGLDITDVKVLERNLLAAEERNAAILKALPDVIKESSLRRKDDKMGTLIKQLTKDPIFTTIPQVQNSRLEEDEEEQEKSNDLLGDKDLYSKLIRLEVETREINVRLKQIETLMFLGDTSVLNRLKHFEVTNETLYIKVGELSETIEKVNKDIESIRLIQRVINMTPGGFSMFITYILIILTILIGGISHLLDSYSLKDTIHNIRNPFSLLK